MDRQGRPGGIAPGSAESTASVASEDRTDEVVDALSALARDRQEPTPAPVELTIVLDDGGAPAPAPSQSGASQDGASPDGAAAALGGSAAPVHRGAGTATMSPTPSRPLGGHDRARHETDSGIVAGSGNGAVSGSPTFGSPSTAATGGPPSWRAMFHESAPATAPRQPESPTALGLPTGDALSLYLSPQTATAAIGEHIVIAYDDSIVLVGDNGRLTGNTGDAGQGGVVALDAQSSSFSTESATRAAPVTVAGGGGMTALSAGTGGGANAGAMGGAGGVAGGFVPNAAPGVVSPLIPPMVSLGHDRAVDIAGYEDHSLSVRGQRNIVTYDDSNVFIDRDGRINANTGDLDSGGLNAVNTVRSNVSAGPHCDDGCDDESIIQARAGVFDEGDVAIDSNGDPVWAPGTDAGAEADESDDEGDDSLPTDTGDDGDADSEQDDESDDGDVPDPAEPAETREEAGTTRDAAGTGVDPAQNAPGNSLTIGGDGWDDLGIRVDGADSILTYDDSNVVIGGSGDVNAQIGDADTGGTALMNTEDSEAHGGNSR